MSDNHFIITISREYGSGGRVLAVTAVADTLQEARAKAYAATERVHFANKYMRHDIGKAIDEA